MVKPLSASSASRSAATCSAVNERPAHGSLHQKHNYVKPLPASMSLPGRHASHGANHDQGRPLPVHAVGSAASLPLRLLSRSAPVVALAGCLARLQMRRCYVVIAGLA